MKRVVKFFIYGLFFIATLVLFMPKESLYYLGEKHLKEFDVVVSNEKLLNSFLSLNISDLEISVKGIESAEVGDVQVTLLGLYNRAELHEIKLSSLVESYLPPKIEFINIYYSLVDPLSVKATSTGDFGEVYIEFELLDLMLNATLKPSKIMLQKYKNSLRFFKKSQGGEYVYAKSIK